MSERTKHTPFTKRIDAALAGGALTFYELAMRLYPDPKSWRYQVNGGPPGCYMALSAALRRGGYDVAIPGPGPSGRKVYPRTPSLPPAGEG